MAVRFLPPPEDRVPVARDENENLAEVVEMRSWLRPADEPAAADVADVADAVGAADGDDTADGDSAVDVDASTRTAGVRADVRAPARAPRDRTEKRDRVTRVQFAMADSAEPVDSGDTTGADVDAAADSASEPGRGQVYDDAVRLLARRARSSGELRSDLLALDHSADEVSIVIDEFHASHYLDDMGLARAQSEKLRDAKGASSSQIRRKLRERKLPDHVIDEVVSELDTDEEYELLREAAQKRADKLGGLDRQTAQRRLVAFLARRGWSGEPAMRAVNEALDGTGRSKLSSHKSSGVRFQ